MTWSVNLSTVGEDKRYHPGPVVSGESADVSGALEEARKVKGAFGRIDRHGYRIHYRVSVADGQREVANLGL